MQSSEQVKAPLSSRDSANVQDFVNQWRKGVAAVGGERRGGACELAEIKSPAKL